MANFITQNFLNLQNVNANNMNTFYANTTQQLSAYFPIQPCICNGIGNIDNNFGQSSTSNSFTFLSGSLRFVNQEMPVDGNPVLPAFCEYNGATVTVTASTTPSEQLYVVAILNLTALNASFDTRTNASISGTALTLTQIAAMPNPLLYMPLFAITNTAGVYTVSIDTHCAFNYGFLDIDNFPDVIDDIPTGSVRIGGRIKGAPQQILTQMNPIGSNVPIARISTNPNTGGYGLARMRSENGTANNYSTISATHTDGGDGVFKPTAMTTCQTPDGYSGGISILPNNSHHGYNGFVTSITNSPSTSFTGAGLFLHPDSSNNPSLNLYLSNSTGVHNTGIAMSVNNRPTMLGNLSTLTNPSNGLAVTGDITTAVASLTAAIAAVGSGITSSGTGWVKFGNGFLVQWTTVAFIGSSTARSFSWPTPFTTSSYGCMVSQTVGTLGTTDVSISPSNGAIANLAITTPVSGLNVNVFAIGF